MRKPRETLLTPDEAATTAAIRWAVHACHSLRAQRARIAVLAVQVCQREALKGLLGEGERSLLHKNAEVAKKVSSMFGIVKTPKGLKKGKFNVIRYTERERDLIHKTFMTVYCHDCSTLLLLISYCA